MDISGLQIGALVVAVLVVALAIALAVSTMSADPRTWWTRLVEWIEQSRSFLEDCWNELRRVHWPTREETRAATIAVILGVIFVGLYLGIIDSVLTFVFSKVLS
jgi:preprotein translocase subunit SecE